VNILWIALGIALLVVALADAVSTLVTTRVRRGRWWPTVAFYRIAWEVWRKICKAIKDGGRQERLLGAYGPVSLLWLLVIWVGLEITGWGLIWYALRDRFANLDTFLDAWYFAGVTFFSVGFGDVVPTGATARVLAVLAAFTGVVTTALVIGFLATLHHAYSDREAELLTLDDLSGDYVTPTGLIEVLAREGDTTVLYRRFVEWERWVARVIQSHSAYRMLTMFRSRRAGQGWLAGLGVMLDTSVTTLAVVDGGATREPLALYRRAVELLAVLNQQFIGRRSLPALPELREEEFRGRYERLHTLGFRVRPFDEAWAIAQELRSGYMPQLVSLSWTLLAPDTFKNPEVPYPPVLAWLTAREASPEE
jgi:hypothetical protein